MDSLYNNRKSIKSQWSKGPSHSDLAIFVLLSTLSVVPGVWPVFGFIFSTMDLRRNLLIWWRVNTAFDDVICTYIWPCCQVKIYRILIWNTLCIPTHYIVLFFIKIKSSCHSCSERFLDRPVSRTYYVYYTIIKYKINKDDHFLGSSSQSYVS